MRIQLKIVCYRYDISNFAHINYLPLQFYNFHEHKQMKFKIAEQLKYIHRAEETAK